MEDIDYNTVDGHEGHRIVSHAVGKYISTSGRIFIQSGRITMRHGKMRGAASTLGAGWSRDPEGGVIKTSNVRYDATREFKGRTLTIIKVFESGAVRVIVNFDESFSTCTVDVVYGKENGVPGVVKHGTGGRLVLANIKISGQSCTITDGNMFAGNSE
jgi:hypothetical protein